MKKTALFAVAAAMMAATPAVAQPWNGLYIGGQIGWGWGDVSHSNSNAALLLPDPASYDLDGGIVGGAHIGFSHAMGQFTFGLEADIEATDLSGSGLSASTTRVDTDQIDWMGSLRGRIGVLVSPTWHLYGTAGWAFSESDHALGFVGSPPYHTYSVDRSGVTWGLGVEGQIAPQWTGRLEYRQTDFDDETAIFGGANSGDVSDVDVDAIRLGASFWF